MQNQKGYCTGFKDFYGKEIHVGDKVVEGCNLFEVQFAGMNIRELTN